MQPWRAEEAPLHRFLGLLPTVRSSHAMPEKQGWMNGWMAATDDAHASKDAPEQRLRAGCRWGLCEVYNGVAVDAMALPLPVRLQRCARLHFPLLRALAPTPGNVQSILGLLGLNSLCGFSGASSVFLCNVASGAHLTVWTMDFVLWLWIQTRVLSRITCKAEDTIGSKRRGRRGVSGFLFPWEPVNVSSLSRFER